MSRKYPYTLERDDEQLALVVEGEYLAATPPRSDEPGGSAWFEIESVTTERGEAVELSPAEEWQVARDLCREIEEECPYADVD